MDIFWQAAFDAVDSDSSAANEVFELELKLHIVTPIGHVESFNAAAVAAVDKFVNFKSRALMERRSIGAPKPSTAGT